MAANVCMRRLNSIIDCELRQANGGSNRERRVLKNSREKTRCIFSDVGETTYGYNYDLFCLHFLGTDTKSCNLNCIMGFSGLLRRNSSRRRSFKRIEPRDRAAQSTNSGAQHRSADTDSANREKRTSREIGSMLRKIGDELNNSRLSLNSLI